MVDLLHHRMLVELAMWPRLRSIVHLVGYRWWYWKQRSTERRERRADLRGYPIVNVLDRLRQLHERAQR